MNSRIATPHEVQTLPLTNLRRRLDSGGIAASEGRLWCHYPQSGGGASGEGTFFWKYDELSYTAPRARRTHLLRHAFGYVVVSHEDLAHVQVVLERIRLRFTVRLRALQAFQPVPPASGLEHDECAVSAALRRLLAAAVALSCAFASRAVAHGALRPVCLFIVSRYHVSLMTCLAIPDDQRMSVRAMGSQPEMKSKWSCRRCPSCQRDRVPMGGGRKYVTTKRTPGAMDGVWTCAVSGECQMLCEANPSDAHPNTIGTVVAPADAGCRGRRGPRKHAGDLRRPPSLSAMQNHSRCRDHGLPGVADRKGCEPFSCREPDRCAGGRQGVPSYINAGTQYMDLSISMSQVERVSLRRSSCGCKRLHEDRV
jgi:hypothetical protein